MNNKENFKPYYDINQHSSEVVARVFQEERKGVGRELRIVHAENYEESRIKTDNWEYNLHSGAEKKATQNVFELFRQGTQMVIWISPASEVYEEGRLNVMLKGEKEGELFFDPYGLPLDLNREESLELGQRLGRMGGKSLVAPSDIETLREQPMGFYLRDKNWLQKCRELMPEMEWAWETIETGKVEENMKIIAGEVKEARQKAGGNNYLFEMIMARNGYYLNVSGSHGGSWLSQELVRGVRGIIAFDINGKIEYRLGKTEGLHYCEHCGCWYSGEKCPVCK